MKTGEAEQELPASRTLPGSRLGLWLLGAGLLSLLVPRAAIGLCLIGLNGLIALLFLWDRARLLQTRVAVQREVSSRLRAGQTTPYRLLIDAPDGTTLHLTLAEYPCAGFVSEPAEHTARLVPGQRLTLSAQLLAAQHGRGTLRAVALRKQTRFGLCARIETVACETQLRAYPNLPLGRAPLLTMERRDLGSSPQRMLSAGQGSELDSLREYVPTDSLRSIDWKATARRNRPITRAYRPERSQTVWLVLDASRAMTLPVEDDSRPRFVAALEAVLELAHTALEGGDRVGLLVYAREQLLRVLPGRGRAHFLQIVERLLDVQAQASELAVEGLVSTLAVLAPKRSLIVLFTDLDNEGDLRALASQARMLSRRHLTLCFSLETRTLQQLASQPSETDEQVYQKLAAISLRDQRRRLAKLLSERGIPVLEASARGLARTALQRYREVKLSGRL